MIEAEVYLKALQTVKQYLAEQKTFIREGEYIIERLENYSGDTLVSCTKVSVRLYNLLASYLGYGKFDKMTLYQLREVINLSIFRKQRHVGVVSIRELKELLGKII